MKKEAAVIERGKFVDPLTFSFRKRGMTLFRGAKVCLISVCNLFLLSFILEIGAKIMFKYT